ncbi:DNA translocase FtsK 4TM domain-containing protein, partial [Congregibacter sp.]
MARQQIEAQDPASPRLREGLLIAVAAVCAYLLVSLVSYSQADPGWSGTGSGGQV